jgi:hypothetical protein
MPPRREGVRGVKDLSWVEDVVRIQDAFNLLHHFNGVPAQLHMDIWSLCNSNAVFSR